MKLFSRMSPAAAGVAVAALLAFAPAFWWGAPTATAPDRKLSWGTDDETPLGPLAELHNIIQPKKDRNLGYPLMYSFMAAGMYAPYLGYLVVSGDFEKVSGEYPFGLKDPVRALQVLTGLAHFLTVLLGVGIALCVFRTAKLLWDEKAGLAAAGFIVTGYPYFYYARSGNVDVPMTFFVALALMSFVWMMKEGITARRGLLLGAAMGFGLGTKEACYSMFPLIPIALIYFQYKRGGAGVAWYRRPDVATAVAGVLAFGFGSGLFIEPSRYFAHLEFHAQLAELYASGQADHVLREQNLAGYFGLAVDYAKHLAGTHTWTGLAVIALGVGVMIQRRDGVALILVGTAVLYLLLSASRLSISTLRMMLPVSVVFAVAGGYAVRWALDAQKPVTYAVLAVTAVAFAWGGLRGVDLTHAMLNDSRYAAAEWLAPRLAAGDRVDHFGGTEKLPPLPVGVESTRAAPHLSFHKKAPDGPEMQASIKERWDEDPPKFIVLMPDHAAKHGPFHHTCPPQTFRDLESGALGWDRVQLFQTPSLFPWVQRPKLDYPVVNPPIRIYAKRGQG
ncbi:MAG: glycosyltransferase family 39 protein [Deltaproteobacteria bacterium]